MNANFEAMSAKYGPEDARKRLEEIRDIGGFGSAPVESIGGFDLFGALAESNEALSDKTKARLAELGGVSRKEVEKKIDAGRKAFDDGDRSKDFTMPPEKGMDLNRK